MQEKLVLLATAQVFHEVPVLIESLLGITISESQVYRTLQAVSDEIEDPSLPSTDLQKIEDQTQVPVYGMIDGSFLFTDDGWKETKVGRVFSATPNPFTKKWDMSKSEYVAESGHYEKFTEKFELLLPPESTCKKVFVTDGASWITNYLSSTYPGSMQILDFFHVCEKLANVPKVVSCESDWFERQKAFLLSGELNIVCSSIQKLKRFDGQSELLNYLEKNTFRMHYDEYRAKGLMISSGPIESAHRTILQIRMKRSGQRWSNRGRDALVKLRVAYKSGKESLITNALTKQAA